MKARVYVSFKPTVLDPARANHSKSAPRTGAQKHRAVRQGKFFEIEVHQAAQEAAAKELEQIARDVLANPVMEDYQVEFLD